MKRHFMMRVPLVRETVTSGGGGGDLVPKVVFRAGTREEGTK